MTAPGPFLRWAGGKRLLLPTLLATVPARFGRYFEPFAGGAALLWAVQTPGAKCTIGDVNTEIIHAYTQIRDDVDGLVARLRTLGADTSKAAYLSIRAQDPLAMTPQDRAARAIFLNRLCFNGLWRENAAGQFNVPYGKLTRPTVCNEELLRACSARLNGADIRLSAFADTVRSARRGDLVYFDPPYIPLTPTASFSRYNKADFGRVQQQELSATIGQLIAKGCHVILSNSDTELTRQIYADLGPDWALHGVKVTRSISASAHSRNQVGEVIGTSFPLTDCRDPAAAKAALGV